MKRRTKNGVRPHYQHQMALLELADSMALGHLFTDWVSRPPAGLHSPNLTSWIRGEGAVSGPGCTEDYRRIIYHFPQKKEEKPREGDRSSGMVLMGKCFTPPEWGHKNP